MQREPDEDDEDIQKAGIHYEGRASHIGQNRRKGLQPYNEDNYVKRLGPRSKSALREQATTNDALKVNPRCCGFPCNGNHSDDQKTSRFALGIREPQTRSFNTKEPKSFGALLTGKFFRPKNYVLHPPWEKEWSSFREQIENEVKQMREICQGVQEICQDMKRMGSQRDDTSGISSRHRSVSEAVFGRVDEFGQSKGGKALNATHIRENGYHQSNRRAKSAPRTRVNWDSDLPEEGSEHARAPSAALFKEIIGEKRLYIRKFVAALIKYEENRFLKDDFEFEQKSNSLRQVVGRLLPRANFANFEHLKYGIEAWLSRVVFKEVEKSEERDWGPRTRRHAWEEYRKLSLLSPVDAINPGEDHCENFHVFCNLKFITIRTELKWLEEWPDDLVADLLEAAKYVYQAKNLANAFDSVASPFVVKASAKFDARLMEPLETPNFFQTNSLLPSTTIVVSPGYFYCDRIIKCQVCLASYYSSDSS